MKPIKDDLGTEEAGIEGWGDELISKETGGIGDGGSVLRRWRPIIGFTITVALGLTLPGCAALGLTGDPANDLPIVSQDILKTVNVACAEYAPIGALAVVVPDPKVQSIALMTNGVCDLATGTVVPGVESKLDASSAAWVGLSVGMLKALGVQPVAAPATPAVPPTKA